MTGVRKSFKQKKSRAPGGSSRRGSTWVRTAPMRTIAKIAATAVAVTLAPVGIFTAPAEAVTPVGQGFELNESDLRFILRQIRISERHTATATPANPCSTLIGGSANQIPTGPNGV